MPLRTIWLTHQSAARPPQVISILWRVRWPMRWVHGSGYPCCPYTLNTTNPKERHGTDMVVVFPTIWVRCVLSCSLVITKTPISTCICQPLLGRRNLDANDGTTA